MTEIFITILLGMATLAIFLVLIVMVFVVVNLIKWGYDIFWKH